jgi:hypothetical protein
MYRNFHTDYTNGSIDISNTVYTDAFQQNYNIECIDDSLPT